MFPLLRGVSVLRAPTGNRIAHYFGTALSPKEVSREQNNLHYLAEERYRKSHSKILPAERLERHCNDAQPAEGRGPDQPRERFGHAARRAGFSVDHRGC